jgi:hypothetical protein
MKLHTISLINGIVLVLTGLWAYIVPEVRSILILNKGVKLYYRGIANAVMILTFIVLAGLLIPLKGAIERNDTTALIQVIIMMVASLISLVFFIKRFINSRLKQNL